MRVNVYAEEMTNQIEIISKTVDGQEFTGLRIYLHMPVSYCMRDIGDGTIQVPLPLKDSSVPVAPANIKGPFVHRPGDDDSSAVTFWGKRDLREVLKLALIKLDDHYANRTRPFSVPDRIHHLETALREYIANPGPTTHSALSKARTDLQDAL